MIEIQENVSLAKYSTFHIGGLVRFFIIIKSLADLKEAIKFQQTKKIDYLILGVGSNILFSDEGFSGLVIKNEIKSCKINQNQVTFGAGVIWTEAVKFCVENNLAGLENLAGIPGTVGATPIQNVGAYGLEIKDVLASVLALNVETGEIKTFSLLDCQFSYRSSYFKKSEAKKYVIVEVTFNLKLAKTDYQPNLSYKDLANYFANSKEPITLKAVYEAVIKIRAEKFPNTVDFGLAGSFFKNPIITRKKYLELLEKYPNLPKYDAGLDRVKIPLGWILDKVLNMKGYRVGRVGLYEKQAIVLVNYGEATAKEVRDFADYVKNKVFNKCGLRVEEEVEMC